MKVLHIRWTREEIIADRLVPSELRKLVSKEGQPIPQEPSQLKAYAISTTISQAIQEYIRVFDPDLLAHPNRWPQLLNFTQLAFGPQGLPHLQTLALGDFSVAGRADPENAPRIFCRGSPNVKITHSELNGVDLNALTLRQRSGMVVWWRGTGGFWKRARLCRCFLIGICSPFTGSII
jgi:hypothetical protein